MRKILGLTLALAFFTGCATISEGPSQMVTIRASDGANLNAIIETKSQVGWFGSGVVQTAVVTLPATVAIGRSDGARVRILAKDNPGYRNTEFVIEGKESVGPWYWGNIALLIFTGLGGSAGITTTDPLSGSMWQYSNPNFSVPVMKTTDKESK